METFFELLKDIGTCRHKEHDQSSELHSHVYGNSDSDGFLRESANFVVIYHYLWLVIRLSILQT
jgi:hypothetical protein